MTDRDRLVELINNTLIEEHKTKEIVTVEFIADYLLSNGVIVPPCKVGDIVYTIFDGEIETLNVNRAKTEESMEGTYRYYDAGNKFLKMPFAEHHIGKTVFLTREEAEEKLKELQNAETKKS